MYATVHQFRRILAREGEGWGRMLAAGLHARPGCLGACTLAQVAGATGVVVTFWPDHDGATAAAGSPPASGWTWFDTGVYQVAFTGSASGAAKFAQATWFDGPRRRELAEAELRAGRDRIWPVAREIDGVGCCYLLQADDRACLVLGFADRIETIEAVQKAAMGTELLPGEDVALLPGPDRIDLHHVSYAALPALTAAGEQR
jgi:hypothetical protein